MRMLAVEETQLQLACAKAERNDAYPCGNGRWDARATEDVEDAASVAHLHKWPNVGV